MAALIDSSVLIDVERRRLSVVDLLVKHAEEEVPAKSRTVSCPVVRRHTVANKTTKRTTKNRVRARKTVSSLLHSLPSLLLKEETIEQIETQAKERRKHPARTPRL